MLVIINNMSFDHQDWNNVVFTKKQSTTLTTKDIRNSNYNTKHRVIGNANRTTSGQKLHKIHNETESFEVKKIPYQGRAPTEGMGQKVDILKERMF